MKRDKTNLTIQYFQLPRKVKTDVRNAKRNYEMVLIKKENNYFKASFSCVI